MKSLRARVLMLIAAFGMATAVLLAAIMYSSVSNYYADWIYDKACRFADRILETHPNLWHDFESRSGDFGTQLTTFTLYSPATGLYLLDSEGRLLAGAGPRSPHWSGFSVDLQPARDGLREASDVPLLTRDPDDPARDAMAAARPILQDGVERGWLLVVPRQMEFDTQMPEMLRSYALRTAATIGLTTIALGALLTIAVIALLTRPLTDLARATERVRQEGFCGPGRTIPFPGADRDDEIGDLTKTFREAFDRLQRETERVQTIDTRRREMIASVSHDLRTPLTALIGQLETIRLKGAALPEPERRRLLVHALDNADHLRRLTDALAELARLDSPDFRAEPEPIALGELADDVVHRFTTSAQEGGVQLEIDYPDGLPLALVDAALVERALANLLDNALRVSPQGSSVRVRVQQHNATLRLEVADNGPGVALEDQGRVFDRFFQSSHARSHRGTSGLGLAIVRRVAELHGGSAGLQSTPGSGSRFFIDLPVAA